MLPDIKKRMTSGENYFTVPIEYFRLTDIEQAKLLNMLEESGQKILGSIFYFEDPSFKKYAMNVNLVVWQGYDKDLIRTNIISKLSEYFSNFKRKDLLPKSDLIAIIEGIDGVDTVNVFYISEDVETELGALLDINTIDSSLSMGTDDKTALKVLYASNPNASIEEKIKMVLNFNSVKTFIELHLDANGDILFQKGEIPLMRGGFKNRTGKVYWDLLDPQKLCSLNINFIRESVSDSAAQVNKANVNVLRQ